MASDKESFEIDNVLDGAVKADPLTPKFKILREHTDVLLVSGGKEIYKPDELPTEEDMVDETFVINADLANFTSFDNE